MFISAMAVVEAVFGRGRFLSGKAREGALQVGPNVMV